MATLLASSFTLAFGWQPEIRGIVVVLIAVGVLMGSVYLLLATNLGARLGLLVALGALFGWLTILASMWWIYGIGLKGADPTWKPVEVIVGDISNANNEIARNLDGWEKLPTDDPSRGQAVASSDAILTIQSKVFTSPTDYVVTDVYTIGGGTYPKWFFSFRHDPHYALVQVQPVKPQISEAGKPPPTPVADETQPVVSVLMIRDLGYRRRPAALITLGALSIFLAIAWILHSRDKESMRRRGIALEKV
jgi:hypothetical protein